MVKFDPTKLSKDVVATMTAVLAQDSANAKRSPLTEFGEEHGIQIFNRKAMGYTNNMLLAYIPRMGVSTLDEKGALVPFRVPMRTVTMKKLGNNDGEKNWAGAMPYFEEAKEENRVFAALGQSGCNKYLQDFIKAAFDYRKARIDLDLARNGYKSVSELVADSAKYKEEKDYTAQFREYIFLQTSSNSEMWFPITVISTTKDENGKFTLTPEQEPLRDADGNPTVQTFEVPIKKNNGEVMKDKDGNVMHETVEYKNTLVGETMWHRLSTKAFTEKLAKAFKLQSEDPNVKELGGFFVLFNYVIDEKELAKANNGKGSAYTSDEAKSSASLNIQVVPESGSTLELYEKTERLGLQAKWDAEAQEKYNALFLVASVRSCALLTDEEVNEKLNQVYGSLEEVQAEIQRTQDLAENLKQTAEAGGASPITGSVSSRLGGLNQLPPGVTVDPANDMDFGAEE